MLNFVKSLMGVSFKEQLVRLSVLTDYTPEDEIRTLRGKLSTKEKATLFYVSKMLFPLVDHFSVLTHITEDAYLKAKYTKTNITYTFPVYLMNVAPDPSNVDLTNTLVLIREAIVEQYEAENATIPLVYGNIVGSNEKVSLVVDGVVFNNYQSLVQGNKSFRKVAPGEVYSVALASMPYLVRRVAKCKQ